MLGRGHRPIQIVVSPPLPKFSRTLDTLWSILILGKISKFGATRYKILRLKCTKFDFRWGSATHPTGKLIALPKPPSCI